MKKVIISMMIMVAVLLTIGIGFDKTDSYAAANDQKPVKTEAEVSKEKPAEIKKTANDSATTVKAGAKEAKEVKANVKSDKKTNKKTTQKKENSKKSKDKPQTAQTVAKSNNKAEKNKAEKNTGGTINKDPGKTAKACLKSHEWKCINTVNPTCKNEGSKKYKCNNCDAVKTETLSKTDHKIVCIKSSVEYVDQYIICKTEHACKYCGGEWAAASSIRPNEKYQHEETTAKAEESTSGYTLISQSKDEQ